MKLVAKKNATGGNKKQRPGEEFTSSLCFPDNEKTCFACCPPIRQPDYEHIQHRKIVERMLRENTEAFRPGEEEVIPITGFSCWALGYLDNEHKQIGCLLHPARNGEKDLRYLVDYGEKCGRETCQEAKIYSILSVDEKDFWISLADGLDSFSYSSRKTNPLFNLLGWGKDLLGKVSKNEKHMKLDRETFFSNYPFFTTIFSPKAHSYIISNIVTQSGVEILKSESMRNEFENFTISFLKKIRSSGAFDPEAPYVHRLNLDWTFLDFLRLSVGISRIGPREAEAIKKKTDSAIRKFCRNK